MEDAANIDLIVPEAFAGGSGRRDARLPGANERAARRTPGLEAAIYDNDEIEVAMFDGSSRVNAYVAGHTALLISKLHKLGERLTDRSRLKGKDVSDVFRLLRAARRGEVVSKLAELRTEPVVAPTIVTARNYLGQLFIDDNRVIYELLAEYLEDEDETATDSLRALTAELFEEWPS